MVAVTLGVALERAVQRGLSGNTMPAPQLGVGAAEPSAASAPTAAPPVLRTGVPESGAGPTLLMDGPHDLRDFIEEALQRWREGEVHRLGRRTLDSAATSAGVAEPGDLSLPAQFQKLFGEKEAQTALDADAAMAALGWS